MKRFELEIGHIFSSANVAQRLITVVFFSVLYMNVFLTFNGVEFLEKFHENRNLAPVPSSFRPERFIESLPIFYRELDAYVRDHFAFRKPLIIIFNSLRYYFFDSSPTSKAMIGKNGWIFYGSKSMLSDYGRSNELEEKYLLKIERSFFERKLWLSKRNIGFVLVIVPNKHNLYSQFMPAYLKKGANPSNGELLIQRISSHRDLTVNLFSVFRENSTKEQLYYKIDTHWNHAGAKLAVKSVIQQIKNICPDLHFRLLPSMTKKTTLFSTGNFGLLMGVPLREQESIEIPVDGWAWEKRPFEDVKRRLPERARVSQMINPKAPPTRVLVLGDSYMARFDKYLAEAFGHTIFINLWFTDDEPENRFPHEIISSVNPDLVIFLVAERRLGSNRHDGFFLKGENPKQVRNIGLKNES